ncbi:MAG: hypothetical protein LQ341_005243 [Variospora aurantia]|nr:MAG: hypothetical protein LQ341_005243 [Variospora aurantia]
MPSSPLPFVVALSGLSSTGKSTIATHLPLIFPPPHYTLTILHVDDFYKPQTHLPFRAGHLDWDCTGSLDWPKLEAAVRSWRAGKQVAEGKVNPQPESDTGVAGGGEGISQALVEELRGEFQGAAAAAVGSLNPGQGAAAAAASQRVLILDGFLLFTPSVPSSFRSLLDLKVLLRAPYAEAKRRREARSGYTTMEGWWEDPPGYFDTVVWPNYVEENQEFFVGGDVEGDVDEQRCQKEAVKAKMGADGALGEVLRWVSGEMVRAFEERGKGEGRRALALTSC